MRATDADCAAFSYEVKMIYVLLHHLTEPPTSEPLEVWDTVYRNAMIESHLIHSRVLIEFLCGERVRPDDIVVGDFIETAWVPKGPEVDRLKSLLPDMHKRLAHLTRRRESSFPWPSITITGDLMTLVSQFLDRVRAESSNLDSGLDHAQKACEFFYADYGQEYRALAS